jgi:hypothetical protein
VRRRVLSAIVLLIGGRDVQERALGDLHLWYWYDGGPFIDPNVDFAATIDAGLQQLLEAVSKLVGGA